MKRKSKIKIKVNFTRQNNKKMFFLLYKDTGSFFLIKSWEINQIKYCIFPAIFWIQNQDIETSDGREIEKYEKTSMQLYKNDVFIYSIYSNEILDFTGN